MNKKGVFNTTADLILIFIFLVAILLSVYPFGIWKKTEAAAEEKLPTKEKLQSWIEKFTKTPGEIESEVQKKQVDIIANSIQETIRKMNDIDCIEEIDFNKVEDKDFVLEPLFTGGKTNLRIYKIINGQEGSIFNYPFNEEIRIFENLDRIETVELKNFGDFIYKNRVSIIIFTSKDFDKELKNRPLCSNGTYLYDITPDELEYYNIIKVYQTEYVNEQDLQDFKLFISTFTRDKEKRWVKEKNISTSYNNQVMANTINTLRDKKFRIDLI